MSPQEHEAVMQAEDLPEPPANGGTQAGAVDLVRKHEMLGVAGQARPSVCERYVSRKRLAELMGVSVKTIDRLVAQGMPSVTWGLRRRLFLPSQALVGRSSVENWWHDDQQTAERQVPRSGPPRGQGYECREGPGFAERDKLAYEA